jgi:RNA polymerase sigma-70 factor (ECF subfamily)
MQDNDWLAKRFQEHRPRLTAIAKRMLGSVADAEDAVQEAWLRLSRSDTDSLENLGGWLTAVLSRVCLNVLQARRPHADITLEPYAAQADETPESDPEHEAVLADSIGLALTIVLQALPPTQRVAFVLHDVFNMPFEEIAPIVERSEAATRQLASRARRRIRIDTTEHQSDVVRKARLVDAFLAAARSGEFERLLSVLDPNAVLHADRTAVEFGAPSQARGHAAVAEFCKRAHGAVAALINGSPAAVWMPGGVPRVVFEFGVRGEKIAAVNLIADPDRIAQFDLLV